MGNARHPLPTRSLRLLRAGSTSSGLCLHYACKRSHPFVQDSGFVSHVKKQQGVWSRSCRPRFVTYNTVIVSKIWITGYLDLREGFNFSPKGFRQNSCPNVFFLPEAFFSARGWFLMQCLPKRDFGHFRPFAGYFCPFTVSFRPTIVRIQRKTCRSFRLKKEKQPVGGNS